MPVPPSVPCQDLGGQPAECVSSGQALPLALVTHLFEQGWHWGQHLSAALEPAPLGGAPGGYLVVGECVVAGTTTALAILKGLGFAAEGKVNSSHPQCNHAQKLAIAEQGLRHAASPQQLAQGGPWPLIAAVGDPMQPVVAGLALAASQRCGVLLAGGTQMLAVYALARAIAQTWQLSWQQGQIVVGTTRWVAEDPTGDTPGLARLLEAPLIATTLSFAQSRHASLRAYEAGFVKEGVGGGGCAIAGSLYQGWQQAQLLDAIDELADRYWAVSPALRPH